MLVGKEGRKRRKPASQGRKGRATAEQKISTIRIRRRSTLRRLGDGKTVVQILRPWVRNLLTRAKKPHARGLGVPACQNEFEKGENYPGQTKICKYRWCSAKKTTRMHLNPTRTSTRKLTVGATHSNSDCLDERHCKPTLKR